MKSLSQFYSGFRKNVAEGWSGAKKQYLLALNTPVKGDTASFVDKGRHCARESKKTYAHDKKKTPAACGRHPL